MKLLLFGASGRIGQRIAAEAARRDHELTAVYRTPPQEIASGATAVTGDVRDPAPLASAGFDAVIAAVGAAPLSAEPDYTIYLDAAQALVGALRELSEPPRLLVVGGAGSLRAPGGGRVVDTPQFPAEFRDEARAQARALEYYQTVDGIPWTYISPAAVIEPGVRTGRYQRGGDDLLLDSQGHSEISMEDYAVALVDEVERGEAIGRRITVAW